MSQINVNTITDEAGTGPVNFPYDFTIAGSALVIPPAHSATTVSGATQALDVGLYNFFNAGDLSADVAVSFTSVPTDALWTYTAKAGFASNFSMYKPIIDSATFLVGSQETVPKAIFFKPDGLSMYITGSTGDDVNQYTLSTAWDVSTATYTSMFDYGAQDIGPQGLAFSTDGTKMYFSGSGTDTVYQYTLGTAWDVTTASYSSLSKSVGSESGDAMGVAFSSDGTKMYVIGSAVFQYTLSTAWNVSTATYDSVSLALGGTDLSFSPDGTKLFILDNFDTIYQYNLATAWDLSTATYSSFSFNVTAQEPSSGGLTFSYDGDKMYVVGNTTDTVYQYTTSRGALLSWPAAVQNPPSTLYDVDSQVTYTFVTNNGGTTVKLINEAVL